MNTPMPMSPPCLTPWENEDFYDHEGQFLPEKAKDALLELLQYHHYPIFKGLRERLWVSDYGKGNYAQLGIALLSFINNVKDRYMLMDIILLPHQMLCEHQHFPAEGLPAKMEAWLVRHGKSYIVGVGEPNMHLFPHLSIPSVHANGSVSTQHVVEAEAGTLVPLAEAQSAHWQMAGPEGAIITEVANVHSNAGVERPHPSMR